MSLIIAINTKKATIDPESVFAHPSEVAEHIALTRGQKIATLERWAFAVRARVDAMSEGMIDDTGAAYVCDVELLRRIEKTLDALRQAVPAETDA